MKLSIKNLKKSFNDKEVLKGISFDCEAGKAIGLLGRNGSGKTTTIRIILDIISKDSGEIFLDDKELNVSNVKIGYLPEERGLYPKIKLYNQLIYFAKLKGLSKSEAKTSIDYWINKLELNEYKNKKLSELSKGNQQKVQLIVCLLNDPDIVILDEPFSGLDPVNSIILKNVVKELIDSKKIVILSSHQMNYIEEFCDYIVILNNGKIIESDSIVNIKSKNRLNNIILSSIDNNKLENYLKHNLNYYFSSLYFKNNDLCINLNNMSEYNNFIKDVLLSDCILHKITIEEPSLNDIFIKYVKGNT